MKPVIIFSLVFCVLISVTLSAEKEKQAIRKTNEYPAYSKINLNSISTWISNDGIADNYSSNSGFEYPKSSGKYVIYESGFLWGGKIDQQVRVGGSAYRSGLTPGKIIAPGSAEDPSLPKNRIFRVRPDYQSCSLSAEMDNEGISDAAIRAQYEKDWNEWPAADGAPYTDNNGNGSYDPAFDLPGIKGASQTIWYVCNDLDPSHTNFLYGSSPIGIEMQVTIWIYPSHGSTGNVIFKKYKLINKSTSTIQDMYLTIWSDPDLGDASDDFVGCDSLLNLGFVYNSSAHDAIYDSKPPAVGFGILQGPVVNGTASDIALFDGREISGKKNLGMSSFYYFLNQDINLGDPTMGDYQGTLQFYNFMQGKIGNTGEYYSDPSGNRTRYALPGDPLTESGWLDGQLFSAGDRRMGLGLGAFNMAPGDTQEVVFAQIVQDGSVSSKPNFGNLILLKNMQSKLAAFWQNGFLADIYGKTLLPINNESMLYTEYIANTPVSISAYNWSITSKPSGSNAQLTSYEDSCRFTPDVEGEYSISLTITASDGLSASSTFDVSAVQQVSVNEENTTLFKYSLYQNYPNPFNPSTTIKFSIPVEERVQLKIFDSIGKEVQTLLDKELPAGLHECTWSPGKLVSGVYFYTIQAGSFRDVRKIMLLR